MPAPRWAVGMRKLGIGMYLDSQDAIHVSTEEICEHFNVEPTPWNVEAINAAALDAIHRFWPGNIIAVEHLAE